MSAIPLALRLVQARELAETGRPDEAERLLAPSPSALPEEPLALQTLAVVVTRRGDYPRARRLWQELARRQPGHREAAAMLDALDDWAARPSWMRAAPALAAALVAVLLIGLVFAFTRGPRTASAPATPIAPARPAAVSTPYAPAPAYANTPRPAPLPPAPAYPAQAAPAAAEEEEPATVSFSVKPAKKR